MKYFISFLFLFIGLTIFGQSKKNENSLNFFKIQGGLFYDAYNDKDYTGFNVFNLGLSRWRNKKVEGIELELIAFEIKPEIRLTSGGNVIHDWIRTKRSVELSVYRTYAIIKDVNNGFFAGPFLSGGFIRNRFVPITSRDFPIDQKCYCVGLGLKADYSAQLTERIYLIVGTKLTLLGFGYNKDTVENPGLTISQQEQTNFETYWLQKKFPLMLGIHISI